MEYEAELEWCPGIQHQLADALSHLLPPGPAGLDVDASLSDDYLDSFTLVAAGLHGPMLDGDLLVNLIPDPGPVSPTDPAIPPPDLPVPHVALLSMVVDPASLSHLALPSDPPSSIADSATFPFSGADLFPVPDRFVQLQCASMCPTPSSPDAQPSFFAALQPDLPTAPRRFPRVRIPSVLATPQQ